MPHNYVEPVVPQIYILEWLENTHGELSERTDYFSQYEDMVKFLNDMFETDRLFEIVSLTKKGA